jgi:hypothetical protein
MTLLCKRRPVYAICANDMQFKKIMTVTEVLMTEAL